SVEAVDVARLYGDCFAGRELDDSSPGDDEEGLGDFGVPKDTGFTSPESRLFAFVFVLRQDEGGRDWVTRDDAGRVEWLGYQLARDGMNGLHGHGHQDIPESPEERL